MSMIFNVKCNYIKEITCFLYRYFNDETMESLHENLKKKSGYTKEVQYTLEKMEIIYYEILNKIEVPKELSMYFVAFQEEEGIISGIADALLFKCYLTKEEKLDTLKKIVKDEFHKNNGRSFLHVLENSGFEIKDELQTSVSEEEFVRFLDTSGIKEEMKWKVYKIFHEFDKHTDILFNYIEKVYLVFKEVYKKHEKDFDGFVKYWNDAQEHNEIQEKLNKVVGLLTQEDYVEVTLRPCWMGCNSISLYGEDNWDDIVYYVGLFFTDYNFFDVKEVTNKEMCTRLKLLSDPSKYEILRLIQKEGKYGAQLAEHLNLTTATISHHVNALMNSGMITLEKDSNRIYYHANKNLVGLTIDQLRHDLCED